MHDDDLFPTVSKLRHIRAYRVKIDSRAAPYFDDNHVTLQHCDDLMLVARPAGRTLDVPYRYC
jgi:hypothetical protein